MENFKEGMITRIYCEDFLTYNSIECYPCAKLNMIVGPNGTGKSSLVNAIVLGLGGKTSVIGRAKQLSAYVKRNCNSAKIEIELYSQPSNYVIGREFNIENKNSWRINGETASLKQVESLIQKMNIQVDNLCQFLPQDRVQDFAKMDSKQLLENTLKTVGSNQIVELHENLKDLRTKENNLESEFKVMKSNLESERKKIARLETEVKVINERQELLNTLKNMEIKKSCLELNEKEKQKREVLEDRSKILKMKEEAERNLAPFEKEIQEAKENIEKLDKNINRQIKVCGDSVSIVKQKLGAFERAEDQIDTINNRLKQKLDQEQRKANKISTLGEEIRKLEEIVNPEKEAKLAQEVSKMIPILSKKNNEVSSIQAQAQEIEEAIAEITRTKLRTEGALEREMSAANKKLEILSRRFPVASQAYQWLQQNRHQFSGPIHGPIMLELNCGEEVAKYAEFVIPQRDLVAFVCENKEDMNKLLRIVRDGLRLPINVVQAPRNFNVDVRNNYKPTIPLQQIKKYGFWSYLLDLVDGPNSVLNYICHNYGLHRIPLGNKQTNDMGDQIPDQINYYFSDTHQFLVRRSKYSGEKSSRIVIVRPCVFLAGSTNVVQINLYKQSIAVEEKKLKQAANDLNAKKSQMTALERQRDDLWNQKRTLDQELNHLRTGRSKLKMRREELNEHMKDALNPELETAKAKDEICKVVTNLISEPRNILKSLKNYQDTLRTSLFTKLKLGKAQDILHKKRQASLEATKKLDDSKRYLLNVEDKLKEVQMDYKRAHEKTLKLTEGLNPADAKFKKKFGTILSSLPDNLDVIAEEISRISARADCLDGGRASVLEEYEKTKKTIQHLESAIANPEQKLQEIKRKMQEKRNVWMPQVEELIARINNNFTTFFSQMKCVGEVSLEKPEDEDDYSKYGICIKVQFRETSRLQKLGPHTQSGGERAVSTAIYMLSLQELTTVPFRCVDEINQGMDENNERVVFRLMVNTVENRNSAQCFLLTPKVLKSLDYSENVKVLCIYSGIGSVSHLEFKVDKFLEKIRRSSMRMTQSAKRKHSDSEDSD